MGKIQEIHYKSTIEQTSSRHVWKHVHRVGCRLVRAVRDCLHQGAPSDILQSCCFFSNLKEEDSQDQASYTIVIPSKTMS